MEEKNTKKIVKEDATELLKEYNEQTAQGGEHEYDEILHRDTYADSDCCC